MKVNFLKKISKRIECMIFNHNWKFHGHQFYCVDNYPKFTKLWQDYYICTECKTKVKPKWFNKNWRVKHQFVLFDDIDLPFNLNKNEIEAYKKTRIILAFLDRAKK